MDRLASIPLGELSRGAPALCSQVLRALQSDVELDRLTGRGGSSGRERSAQALELPAMTGSGDAEAMVEAVEALRGVLWEALLEELHAPPPRMVADAADRLGYVCSCALAAAVAAIEPAGAPSAGDDEVVVAARDHGAREAARAETVPVDAVIVDERAEVELPVSSEPRAESPPPPGSSTSDARPLSWDESPPVTPVSSISAVSPAAPVARAEERPLSWDESPPALPSGARDEIEIRDERGAEGPAAWIGSIGHQ
ncbi:MAG TPA: hypothetical protein VNR42_08645, partial [Solirubrobacteraceae bacterium]|nr:hypothetical protein [Solirubrobacteraceae bacterium]